MNHTTKGISSWKISLLIILLLVSSLSVHAAEPAGKPETVSTVEKLLSFAGGLAGVSSGGQWGFINTAGKVVIKFIFKEIGSFDTDLAPARVDKEKWGYINKKGLYVINPKYDGARPFRGGYAPVKKGNAWGMIDKKGRLVIDYSYQDLKGFNSGLAPAKRVGKWGFINKKNKFVLERLWLDAGEFQEGLAPVKNLENQWGFIDTNGELYIEAQFDEAGEFSEGLAPVRVESKWGFVDKKGRYKINPQYEDAKQFSEKLAAVKENGKWGYINPKGRDVITHQFDEAADFSDGFALVQKDGMAFYIDTEGVKTLDVTVKTATAAALEAEAVRSTQNPPQKPSAGNGFGSGNNAARIDNYLFYEEEFSELLKCGLDDNGWPGACSVVTKLVRVPGGEMTCQYGSSMFVLDSSEPGKLVLKEYSNLDDFKSSKVTVFSDSDTENSLKVCPVVDDDYFYVLSVKDGKTSKSYRLWKYSRTDPRAESISGNEITVDDSNYEVRIRRIPDTNSIGVFIRTSRTDKDNNQHVALNCYAVNLDTMKNSTPVRKDDVLIDRAPYNDKWMSDVCYATVDGKVGFVTGFCFNETKLSPRYDIFFIPVYTSDEALENFYFSGDSIVSVKKMFNFERLPSLMYHNIGFTPSKKMEEGFADELRYLDRYWYGHGPDWRAITDSGLKFISSEEEDKNYKTFSLGRFRPVGVVFGVPPRYDDKTANASRFTLATTSSDVSSMIYASTFGTASTTNKEWKSANMSFMRSSMLSKSVIDSTTKQIDLYASQTVSIESYGKNSAWIIGAPTYINYYLYETRNKDGKEPLKIMSPKGAVDFISQTVLPVVLPADTSKYSYLCYDISNPDSADAVFGGLDASWNEVVKGLPAFYANDDIEKWVKDDRGDLWYQNSLSNKKYDVKVIKVNTATSETDRFTITDTKRNIESKSKKVRLKLPFVKERFVNVTNATSTTLSDRNEWIWDYQMIKYKDIGNPKQITDTIYLFLPKEGATAADLPWSSDFMKENNIVTFAICYGVNYGIMKDAGNDAAK
ncbi:MAG TPA: WG repeat-containing protein [Desulfomonilia bacterium]